ncbi:MAG: hypothetical protein HDQ96_13935 [Lachnospiraceae bacterium]|nr:hypothetical protein [Lachnospiraceae bacterium]
MRKKPKGYNQYILFIIILYFFVFKDFLEQYISWVGYTDELFVLLAVPIFVFDLKKSHFILRFKRQVGYGRCVILFLIIGFVSSFVYKYQDFIRIVLPDLLLCSKYWLSLYVGKHIFKGMNLDDFKKNIYEHIKVIACFYVICMCIDSQLHIFAGEFRYGLKTTQLMYSHPTVFVACCILLIMLLIVVKDQADQWKWWLALLLFFMCSTLRSKAFGGAIAVVLICYFVFYRKKKIRVRTLLMFVPLIIVIAWEQIEFYFFSSIQSDSARYQLLAKSFEIAKDHFPLGSGFGTFASYYSGVRYSPLYKIYGLSAVNGLSMSNRAFMSDSFWPMILGQTGWFGCIAYIGALALLFMEIQKLRKVNCDYYAASLCGLSYLLIASMAESAFVHPLAIPIATFMGCLLKKNEDREEKMGLTNTE